VEEEELKGWLCCREEEQLEREGVNYSERKKREK